MPGPTEDGHVAFADAKAGLVTEISLHNDAAGATGLNEITGGDPAYARQTPTYASAAWVTDQAVASLSASLEFSGPANEPVAEVGYWAGSTFLGSKAPTGDAQMNAEGEYTVDQADVTDGPQAA